MKKRRNNHGFTVVELVIAMAVVVLVSATAITLVLSSRKAEERALRNADAVRLAENIFECFKATNGEEAFLAAVAFAEGGKPEGENGSYTITSARYGYTAEITSDDMQLEVVVLAEDKSELLSFSFKKGGDDTP